MPHVPAEIPAGDGEKVGLMFCLLEDDSLITKLTVETQRRLRRRSEHATYVEMRIGVRLVARKITPHNRDYMNT